LPGVLTVVFLIVITPVGAGLLAMEPQRFT
jgi:hypothetical protein